MNKARLVLTAVVASAAFAVPGVAAAAVLPSAGQALDAAAVRGHDTTKNSIGNIR